MSGQERRTLRDAGVASIVALAFVCAGAGVHGREVARLRAEHAEAALAGRTFRMHTQQQQSSSPVRCMPRYAVAPTVAEIMDKWSAPLTERARHIASMTDGEYAAMKAELGID